jgi:GNAT superfamily N-acetyltransferase
MNCSGFWANQVPSLPSFGHLSQGPVQRVGWFHGVRLPSIVGLIPDASSMMASPVCAQNDGDSVVVIEDHPLDNLIYRSLSTRHAHLSQRFGSAIRFHPDVSSLADFKLPAATAAPTQENFDDMAKLVNVGDTVGFLLRTTPAFPIEGWKCNFVVPCLEMVCNGCPSDVEEIECEISSLSVDDVPDIMPLIELTRPGPFASRTLEMGNYYSIRDASNNNFLAAMSGERMKVPGYTEISAVCTHPNYLGRKYATKLMLHVLKGIVGRGEMALLHVRADNDRAIKLYEHLGFRTRCITDYVSMTKV